MRFFVSMPWNSPRGGREAAISKDGLQYGFMLHWNGTVARPRTVHTLKSLPNPRRFASGCFGFDQNRQANPLRMVWA
jgi:hypothetical protein